MKKEEMIKIIENLETEIENFSNDVENDLETGRKELQNILNVINHIEKSWSDSWMGYHASLYYLDFQCPPPHAKFDSEYGFMFEIQPGWNEKTKEDIINVINREYSGPTLEKIGEDILKSGTEHLETLYSEISSNLAFIRSFDNFDKEIKMLDNLENSLSFQDKEEIIKKRMPKNIFTKDTTAVTQGIKVAPHIQCEGDILSFISAIDAIREFIRNTNRLLKQVKVRINAGDFRKENVSKDSKWDIPILLTLSGAFIAVGTYLFDIKDSIPDYSYILFDISLLFFVIAVIILIYVIIVKLLSFHLVRY